MQRRLSIPCGQLCMSKCRESIRKTYFRPEYRALELKFAIELYDMIPIEVMQMILKRKGMQVLLDWRSRPERKSLIVSGARQIGKTYLIRQFAEENYDSWIELNFLEDSSQKDIFSGALDAESVLTGIRLFRPQTSFLPGKTLLFF